MFELSVLDSAGGVVAATTTPVELTPYVELNAASYPSPANARLTAFELISQSSQSIRAVNSIMVFSLSWIGTMDRRYAIDIHAVPADVWSLGAPGSACQGYDQLRLISGSSCVFMAFRGAKSGTANGFRIQVGDTPLTEMSNQQFKLSVNNPAVAVHAQWIAVSKRVVSVDTDKYCQSVLLSTPVTILGRPTGSVLNPSFPAVGQDQTVILQFYPGNTFIPVRPVVGDSATSIAGTLTIVPPHGYSVIASRGDPQPVAGFNAVSGDWFTDTSSNQWILTVTRTTLFGATQYAVQLFVRNPPTAQPAFSWTISLTDGSTGTDIASSRGIRGIETLGLLSTVTVSQSSQRIGDASNSVKVSCLVSQAMSGAFSISIAAPSGFILPIRCIGYTAYSLTSTCRGSGSNSAELKFSAGSNIKPGDRIAFTLSVHNPVSVVAAERGQWRLTTYASDGAGLDTGVGDGFNLYPSEFHSVQVIPIDRRTGIQNVTVLFRPSRDVPFNDYLRIRCPDGVVWVDTFMSTNHSRTNSTSFDAQWVSVSDNEAVLKIRNKTLTGMVEYGIGGRVVVPAVTPGTNRWWLEQYRLTGGGEVALIASSGAAGFETQSIIDIAVVPYDTVAESWQNPVLFVFTTTTGANSVRISAPDGFRFVCPPSGFDPDTSGISYTPTTTNPLTPLPPSSCSVQQTVVSSRNVVDLTTTLVAGTTYAFILAMINPPSVNPASNFFTISTPAESGVAPGFALTAQMVSSQYVAVAGREDKRAGAVGNKVTLLVGIVAAVAPGSALTVTAPIGFSLCGPKSGGGCTVSPALYLGSQYLTFPSSVSCSCSPPRVNVAIVTIPSGLPAVGTYAIAVTVTNPVATPSWNFWRLAVAGQAENWMTGFTVQEVRDVSVVPLNTGNAVAGESAVNPIEFRFTTTTGVSDGGVVKIVAPSGFVAPSATCVAVALDQTLLMPARTACTGDGNRTVTLRTPAESVLAPGSYGVRIVFENPSTPEPLVVGLWGISTTTSGGDLVDVRGNVPGFPINQRVRFFGVTPSTITGLSTTDIELAFALTGRLLPQRNITVTSPSTFRLGVIGSPCTASNGSHAFTQSLIADSTPLPDYITCSVVSNTSVRIANSDPVRFGRTLNNGTTYIQILSGAVNPVRTPALNLWHILAHTDTPLGPEAWTANGYSVQPQLGGVSISNSNPGIGLFTEFGFRFTTVSSTDSGGRITITAPSKGFYFGPEIEGSRIDPLVLEPPPSGGSVRRPPDSTVTQCTLTVSSTDKSVWSQGCPLAFTPCMSSLSSPACVMYKQLCIDGDFHSQSVLAGTNPIFFCQSVNGQLTVQTGPDVTIPAMAAIALTVTGYNADAVSTTPWVIETRNSYSGTKPVDSATVPPGQLYGVVLVDSISPSSTKVSSSNNVVKLTFRLARALPAPASVAIQFPIVFSQNIQMIMAVTTSGAFPASTEWTLDGLHTVRIVCPNDGLLAMEPLVVSLVLANPAISPSESVNMWAISASSATLVDINNRIPGFRVFAEFEAVGLAGRVLAPGMLNTVGISFALASDLPRDNDHPSSYLEVVFPPGYTAQDTVCGLRQFSTAYLRYDGSDSEFGTDKSFIQIPGGSLCESTEVDGQLHVTVTVDSRLMFGLDYAFQVGVVNPTEPPIDNVFVFKTIVDGVVLHLETGVRGLALRELDTAVISPSNPTRGVERNAISIAVKSIKNIPGGSLILVNSPVGFAMTCSAVVYVGLARTTKCLANGNQIVFTTDKADLLESGQEVRIVVLTTNPLHTPQPNWWSVEIRSAAGVTIDVRSRVIGFDVTGTITGSVSAQFIYTNQRSVITALITPSTVQTRAVDGNELVLTAPPGYRFGEVCQSLAFRTISSSLPDYPVGPPLDVSKVGCRGFNNETVIIRFPRGMGLHRFNYELKVLTVNAKSADGTTDWSIQTRAPDVVTGEIHIMDFNSSVPGYALADSSSGNR